VSLQVSEDGAEAAAAGGVVIVEKGAPTHSSPPVIFRADRPFFFFIRDSGTGLIYFSGCLANAPARDLPVTSNPTLLIQHE